MGVTTSKRTWPALIGVFITFFPLAFSGEILEFAVAAIQVDDSPSNDFRARLWLVLIDALLLLGIFGSTLWLWSRNGWPKISIWVWWVIGAALTLVLDILMPYGRASNPWVDLASSLGYVMSLAIILASAVRVELTRALRPKVREADQQAWKEFYSALPLLIGILAAYIGSTVWHNTLKSKRLNCDAVCHGAISPEYFAQLSQVIPLLLVAIGIEAGMFRASLKDPVLRAMTITTVITLCVAEVLAISTLPSDTLSEGHEYFAFIVTLEASFIALAMLVWALVFRSAKEDRQDEPLQSIPS